MKDFVSKDFVETLVGTMLAPLLVIDSQYRVSFMNRAARERFNVCDDEKRQFCYELTHNVGRPCHADDEVCPVREVFLTGLPQKVTHRHSDHDGGEEIVEITAVPIKNDQGVVTEVVEVLRDISNYSGLFEQLRFSEDRYKNLLQSTPDALVIADTQGHVVECNAAVTKVFGYTPDELLGRPITILMPEAFRASHPVRMAEAARTEQFTLVGKTLELVGQHKNGSDFPIELSLSSWKEKNRRYFAAIIRDITQQKTLEHALLQEKQLLEQTQQELHEKHESLFKLFKFVEVAKRQWELSIDSIQDIILLIDENDAIIRMNKTLPALSGISYIEVLGVNWEQFLEKLFNLPAGTLLDNKNDLRHLLSGNIYALNLYTYQEDVLGFSGKVVSLQNITEQRLAQLRLEDTNREIEENRTKLNSALEKISTLIRQVAKQEDFSVRFENPLLTNCWEEMHCGKTSCPSYGVLGTRCWQTAGTYCRGKAQGRFAEKYNDCSICPFYQQATADPIMEIGEQFNNMMHILELKNKELVSLNDELHSAMQMVENNRDELNEAYSQLKATQSRILQQEKMASIGQLAAGVAHEINNPIAFVSSNLGSLAKYLERLKGFVEYQTGLLETIEDAEKLTSLKEEHRRLKIDRILEDLADLIKESVDGTERVRKIVLNLKSFSRVDQADQKMADINECLESTVNIVWNELKYKAKVIKEYGDLPPTLCYPQQLNQVFMNFLVNAAQAIDKQGEITIRSWLQEGFIHVSVRDTGIGIPEEHIHKLFEPFFTTKEVGKGTGLGLSIAYDIVKKHNGEILVESEVGKGSTFTVKIPLVEKKNE